ncbi:hypothetical protein [Halopelagius fulvigenes]|uniref:Small CPxCG-related zinc finger protein n=1 Tax=Halopelagius fulvigenes TaxID=1198324 RepID=A0ABD5TXI5_9EURY
MTTVTAISTDEALPVTCPSCQNVIPVKMTSKVEYTDYNPDGIIDATCAQCGEHFAVGFRRQHG